MVCCILGVVSLDSALQFYRKLICHSCLQKHSKVEDAKLKKTREDLQSKVDFLKKQADVSLETVLW